MTQTSNDGTNLQTRLTGDVALSTGGAQGTGRARAAAHVDGGGTSGGPRSLVAIGHNASRIARLHLHPQTGQKILRGDADTRSRQSFATLARQP